MLIHRCECIHLDVNLVQVLSALALASQIALRKRGNYERTTYWTCMDCDEMASYTDQATRCAQKDWKTYSKLTMVSLHCSVRNGEDLYKNQGMKLSQWWVTWYNREEDFAVFFDIPGLNWLELIGLSLSVGYIMRCRSLRDLHTEGRRSEAV